MQMPEMEINIMKVLIFTTRQLCYNSGYYFAHRIGEEIEKLGIECELTQLNMWRLSQVVRHGSATPLSPVQIRQTPF